MLIIGSTEEIDELRNRCHGNCDEENCIFKTFLECPVDNGNFKDTSEIGANSIIK